MMCSLVVPVHYLMTLASLATFLPAAHAYVIYSLDFSAENLANSSGTTLPSGHYEFVPNSAFSDFILDKDAQGGDWLEVQKATANVTTPIFALPDDFEILISFEIDISRARSTDYITVSMSRV